MLTKGLMAGMMPATQLSSPARLLTLYTNPWCPNPCWVTFRSLSILSRSMDTSTPPGKTLNWAPIHFTLGPLEALCRATRAARELHSVRIFAIKWLLWSRGPLKATMGSSTPFPGP